MAKYLKPDSDLGFIENHIEIENEKFNNLRHVILGFMFGDFDEQGNYVIADEIKRELISLEKYVVEVADNIELCESALKLDKTFKFMIIYEGNKVSLVLVEKLYYEANFKLNSGTYSNIRETVLDVVETSGTINKNALYRKWHIGEFGGQEIDIFSCGAEFLAKYFGIVERFRYLLAANVFLLKEENAIETIEAEYANSVFKLLNQFPKMQALVNSQIVNTLNEKQNFLKTDKPNFAKTFNEVLENAIENNLKVLSEKEKEDFVNQLNSLKNVMNIKRRDIINLKNNLLDVKDLSNLSLQEIAEKYLFSARDYAQTTNVERENLIKELVKSGVLGLTENQQNQIQETKTPKPEKTQTKTESKTVKPSLVAKSADKKSTSKKTTSVKLGTGTNNNARYVTERLPDTQEDKKTQTMYFSQSVPTNLTIGNNAGEGKAQSPTSITEIIGVVENVKAFKDTKQNISQQQDGKTITYKHQSNANDSFVGNKTGESEDVLNQ